MTFATPHPPDDNGCDSLNVVALAVLFAPFYLNDFANVYIHDWRTWLAIDYIFVKALPLLLVSWMVKRRQLSRAVLAYRMGSMRAVFMTLLLATGIGVFLDQNGYAAIAALPGYSALGGMPGIPLPAVNWFDLTVGLAFVGLVEETVFRAVLAELLMHSEDSGIVVTTVVSSLAFGLIHWSAGLHVVIVTSAIGAVFMLIYLRWRALAALALAHAIVDFVDFADVVPKQLFKIL